MFWETLWQYILIFIMAATPWLEILIVIPIGIAIGLNPLIVGIVSFIGNFLPIILIVYSLAWFQQTRWYRKWTERRLAKKIRKKKRGTKNIENPSHEDVSTNLENQSGVLDGENEHTLADINEDKRPRKKKLSKKEKAAVVFQKYGLPGLAFLGPIITGIHLAAIIALSLKANKMSTTLWMGISLLTWTIIITLASYYGLDWLTEWW